MLHRYCDLYPDVAVHLREGSNRELLEALQDGELSCAILSEPRSYKGDWIPLMEDRLLVWLPADSKLAEKEAVYPPRTSTASTSSARPFMQKLTWKPSLRNMTSIRPSA